ncbi:MAG: protein kinase [Myxococcaceae bacterium]|nr:protein kinase [Myxococcaceae bacterium]
MAEVWLARQTGIEGFNRHIVVKRILAHLAEDPEFVAMFLQEARIASRFNHPNIAQIYDLGEQAGTYFIAMEFIHGEDLGRVMRRAWSTGQWVARPLAIRIVADSAAGLYYAHSRMDEQGRPLRIVHRDISPQNILVSFDGSVKLVDFGIAKAADQVSNTKSGAIKGKFAYMAPEQAGGKPLDARTDIFALGLVLYELITGVRPLKRDSEIATLQAALECAIEKPSQVAEVPASLDDVVMRALAKDPEDRYRDARQFQMALEQYLVQEGTVATSVQVSELMETIFADRLREEARLGAPAPSTESSVSNPIAEPAQPLYEDKPSSTQLASNPGPRPIEPQLPPEPPRPPRAPDRPSMTRDEDEVMPELSEPDSESGEQATMLPDDDDGPSIGGFQLPAGTVVPSRSYATSVARRPSAPEMEAARAPRRATRVPPRNDLTAEELPEVADEPRPKPKRKQTSSAMPEAPPRKSRSAVPAAKEPSQGPRKSKLFDKSEVSKLVDVREMKARQAGRLKVMVGVLAIAVTAVMLLLFRDQLGHLLGARAVTTGTPIQLTVVSKPRVHVQVIPPADAVGRQRLELGETPLERVSGAFVNDTILLINDDRAIRYEEKFEYGEPNQVKTINKTFEEGTIFVSINPPLKGATVWRVVPGGLAQKLGQVGMNIKLMEGRHDLEIRADSLDKPFPFEVTLKAREFKKIALDLSSVIERAPEKK